MFGGDEGPKRLAAPDIEDANSLDETLFLFSIFLSLFTFLFIVRNSIYFSLKTFLLLFCLACFLPGRNKI